METDRRWIADEMLGRLARYLRFLGCDVLYAKGMSDKAILEKARADERVILTRDIILSRRGGFRAILLISPDVNQQLREVKAAYPPLREEVAFVRCSSCNGLLKEVDHSTPVPPKGVPEDVWTSGREVHVCSECGQAYWEGTHTKEIRLTLERVFHKPDGPGSSKTRAD
jgi:hypothetical protein